MFIVVGLGNPGEEYAHTRHNAGFETIARLSGEVGANYWKNSCGCKLAEGKLRMPDGEIAEVVLAMPQSFMNLSGGPVSKVLANYDAGADDLIVIHDELDLDPGTCKVKFGGGHAGHNGLKSIFEKIGTRDFARVRVGIGHPPGRKPVPDYVLERPRNEEGELFDVATAIASDAVLSLMREGLQTTQQKFNSQA